MKRLIILLAMLLMTATASQAGTSTSTETNVRIAGNYYLTTIGAVCDTTDGSFDAITLETAIQGFIYQVEVAVDSTATGDYPTNQFNILLTNERGADLLTGVGADLDSTGTSIVVPKPDGLNYLPVFTAGQLQFDITDNTTARAAIQVYIWWKRAN